MTRSKYQAVIFDLDGTLLDTLEDIANAANEVLADLGAPIHSLDAYRTLVGDGVSVLFQRALPQTRTDSDLLQRCIQSFQVTYAKQWNNRSKPYDGIDDLLSFLTVHRLPLAVLSNKPDAFTRSASNIFWRNTLLRRY